MENSNMKLDASDVMVSSFEKMAGGAENLVRYLVNGDGKALYNEISSVLGEENTSKLYQEDVSAERLMLSADAVELSKSKEETIKM